MKVRGEGAPRVGLVDVMLAGNYLWVTMEVEVNHPGAVYGGELTEM